MLSAVSQQILIIQAGLR